MQYLRWLVSRLAIFVLLLPVFPFFLMHKLANVLNKWADFCVLDRDWTGIIADLCEIVADWGDIEEKP